MANAFYDAARTAFGSALLDLLNHDIRVILIDRADYTVNLATHEFLASVAATARVATAALTGKTLTGGVFDASDTTFTSVSGDQSEDLILYRHTGNDATARLICYWDTSIGNSPITPNGSNIVVVWPNTSNKIFKLGAVS